jgi:hypothetical protein
MQFLSDRSLTFCNKLVTLMNVADPSREHLAQLFLGTFDRCFVSRSNAQLRMYYLELAVFLFYNELMMNHLLIWEHFRKWTL